MLVLAGSIIVVALAGCGGGNHEAATATSETAAPDGKIVFTRRSDPEFKRSSLFLVAADGSGLRRFVRDAADAAVSPDGRRLAFVRGDAIWRMGRDGSHQEQLTRPPAEIADSEPAWSADGRTIFFTREDDSEGFSLSIYSVRSDGSGLRHLTESDPNAEPGELSGENSPAASPKGRIVAFVSYLESKTCGCALSHIDAMTPTGRSAELGLSTGFADNVVLHELAWAPDGRRLAVAAYDARAEGGSRSPPGT
jgi:Tol biopolymer transport system component